MKHIIITFIAFVFTLISASNVLANWEYKKLVDEFDRRVDYTVTESIIDYDISNSLIFTVRVNCYANNPENRAVYFAVNDFFDVYSKNRIRLKFDFNEPEYLNVQYFASRGNPHIDLLFTENLIDFKNIISKMKRHISMKVEYYLYKEGRKITHVDLRGFTEEFNKLPPYCQ